MTDRPLAELRFIRDRVMAEIRANPPTLPLLTEVYAEPRAPKETCQQGHSDYVIRGGRRICAECDRQRKRAERASR